jgi:drug/metabolite transporter (DMT)-like permease
MAFSNGTKEASLKDKLLLLKKGLIGIFIAALGTTSYTIVDKFGVDGMVNFAPNVSKLQAAGTYSCIREFFALTSMWLLVFIRHMQGKDKGYLISLVKQYHPYCAGFFAALAYVVILVAMNYVTNVSFVQAFRQLSLPLSALLGFFILKEKITLIRWVALLLIMAGLVLSVF